MGPNSGRLLGGNHQNSFSREFWRTSMKPRSQRCYTWGLLGVLVLLLSHDAGAQSGTSSVHGTVLDPQGRAITDATVSLTNTERSFVRTQKSNASGGYQFTAVPPGVYSIEAESIGFRKLNIEEVRALVDAPTVQDLNLEIGEISESITVTAPSDEGLLNTQDA